jgi:hypothetical protein
MLSVFADTFLIATRMERSHAGCGAAPLRETRGPWVKRLHRWRKRSAL